MKDYSMQHKLNFSTFLVESDRLRFIDDVTDETINKIKNECSDIINLYNTHSKFLYRGESIARKYGPKSIYAASIRTDRKPVEMDEEYHNEINDSLQRLGLTAHRGNSIFCTRNVSDARTWGRTCVIFPKNGFKYTWFANFDDSDSYVYDGLNRIMKLVETVFHLFIELTASTSDPTEAKQLVRSSSNKAFKRLFSDFGIDDNGKILSPERFREYALDTLLSDFEPSSKQIEKFFSQRDELLIAGHGYYGVVIDGTNEPTSFKLITSDEEHPISKILK